MSLRIKSWMLAAALAMVLPLPAAAGQWTDDSPPCDGGVVAGNLTGTHECVGGITDDGTLLGWVFTGGEYMFSDGAELLLDAGFDDCPNNWLCLFEHADWRGRMLQFQSCCTWQNLTAYGFNDQMSSWRNRRSNDSRWAYDINGGGTKRCMDSKSAVSWVGSADNDQASSIRNLSHDGAC